MEILKKFDDFLRSLDTADFYKYIGGAIAVITLCVGLIGWQYYSYSRYYLDEIASLNSEREGEIKKLFAKHERVLLEQKEVNKLLAEDPNFKIKQRFETIINELRLASKIEKISAPTSVDRENYRESALNVTFAGMNMQELCELLQVLDKEKRIFTREIDIQKSKKIPDAIDVTLIIATLLPKTGE